MAEIFFFFVAHLEVLFFDPTNGDFWQILKPPMSSGKKKMPGKKKCPRLPEKKMPAFDGKKKMPAFFFC